MRSFALSGALEGEHGQLEMRAQIPERWSRPKGAMLESHLAGRHT